MKEQLITYAALEPTSHCILSCRFCNRRDVVSKPRHISLDEWEIVLEKLKSQNLKEVKIQGLGETYLHPHIEQICRRFNEVFPDVYTITSTNCQVEMTEQFKRSLAYIDLLYLSVDGYEESYERNRGGAKWDKLISFFDALGKIEKGKAKFAINFVAHSENYKDLEKLHRLVEEKYDFVGEIRINIAQWWGQELQLQDEYTNEFFDVLGKYKTNVKGKSPWTFSNCFWPSEGIFVGANGDVKMCLLNTSAKPYANIFTMSMDEILNAPQRLLVAEECRTDKPGIHCLNCDYKRLSPILGRIFAGKA